MYRGDGEILEETSDEAERPLTWGQCSCLQRRHCQTQSSWSFSYRFLLFLLLFWGAVGLLAALLPVEAVAEAVLQCECLRALVDPIFVLGLGDSESKNC